MEMSMSQYIACFCLLLATTSAQMGDFNSGNSGGLRPRPKPARLCRSGRVFAGSVNNTLAEHLHSTGTYQRLPDILLHGRPVFLHTSHQQYLYFMPADVFGGYWVIGPNLGEMHEIAFIIQSLAPHPGRIREAEWYARYQRDGDAELWTLAEHFKVYCVHHDFMTCNSGRIRLGGLSSYGSKQSHRAGVYGLQNMTNQLRPVYRHIDENTGEELEDFIFYTNGMWMVGPSVGSPMAGMFVADFAMRPEFIMQPWALLGAMGLVTDDGITITCEGLPILQPDTPAVGNESYVYEEEEAGTDESESEESETEISGPGDNETRPDVTCGHPPAVENANLTKVTGRHYLDLAFYSCNDGFFLEGSSGVVCDHNGEWSEVPECRLTINTPTVPIQGGPSSLSKLLRRDARALH